VQAGADPHAKNKMDRTPLQIAMRNNDEKMVIALLHK
jgi:ankyrin repeat protein